MAALVEYDQRYVRRNDGLFFSSSNSYSLCRGCGGAENCGLQAALEPYRDMWSLRQTTSICRAYVPVLTFKDNAGWDSTANTFRRGPGWFNRLNVNDRVRLFNVNASGFFANGIVVEKFQGPLGAMLDDHAHMNHLLKDQLDVEAPGNLHKILATLYGRNYTGFDETFSVIYVEVENSG